MRDGPLTEHPISQHWDWIAAGGKPSQADLDELVGRLLGPDSDMDEAILRRELRAVQREIVAELAVGNSGRARTIAREASAVMAASLGPLPPVDRYRGKSVREIVDSVPRDGHYF